jgi:RND family efflux transporter MFP subunit
MNANVDLRQLAVRRSEDEPRPAARRRHLVTRYLLPGFVLLGFVAVVGWAARDSLLPSQPVTVVPVLTSRAELQQQGTPLFQAAGWVEPRPTPVLVTALAEGVVEKLLVVEGQEVKAGEPVVTLIAADAQLALQAAEADQRLRQAEAAIAKAALKAARINLDRAIHLRAALAEAESMLAQKETEAGSIPFQLKAADSRLESARATFKSVSELSGSGAVSDRTHREAKKELEMAMAAADELKARGPHLKAEVKALGERRTVLRERLELRTEEFRAVAEAEAQVAAAAARLQQAQTAVDVAQLRRERATVRAPMNGRVLALLARPGQRLMGQSALGHPEASSVVSLYDPAYLQVRADVRLEDVPRVQPGQAVKIETPAAPDGPLDGEVLFMTSQADIQKNTLQVKVSIQDAATTIRPDMLVQVTFLAPRTPKGTGPPSELLRLFVPRNLVEIGDGGTRVWLADQTACVARLKTVKLGLASGDLVEVVEGLNAADRLIVAGRDGLRDGARITISGEESTVSNMPQGSNPAATRLPNPGGAGGHQGKH